MTTNPTAALIPSITVDQSKLVEETHEKYGVSYTLVGNAVMMNGVLCKVFSFKRFGEEKTVSGKTVKVMDVCLSFKPVAAKEPVVVDPNAEMARQLAALKKENAKLVALAQKTAGRTLIAPKAEFDSHAPGAVTAE